MRRYRAITPARFQAARAGRGPEGLDLLLDQLPLRAPHVQPRRAAELVPPPRALDGLRVPHQELHRAHDTAPAVGVPGKLVKWLRRVGRWGRAGEGGGRWGKVGWGIVANAAPPQAS
eukprot:gene5442-biopygen8752